MQFTVKTSTNMPGPNLGRAPAIADSRSSVDKVHRCIDRSQCLLLNIVCSNVKWRIDKPHLIQPLLVQIIATAILAFY